MRLLKKLPILKSYSPSSDIFLASLDTHTDHELACLLQQGEEAAFDEIYRRYWKRLFNEAFKRTGELAIAEEIVQDIFIDLWTSRASREINQLFPYLLSAVRYQVFVHYKKSKSLPAFEEPLEHFIVSSEKTDSSFFLNDLMREIQNWLSLQPEKRREIFRLRYLEQFSTKEIAEELEITQKTVQNQLLNGQESLRKAVTKLLPLIVLIPH